MQVKVMVERYGSYEFRIIDIDLESIIAQELAETASIIAGFEDEPKFTIDSIVARSISNISLE